MDLLGTAFVLNLKRRPDRIAHFFQEAPCCFEYIPTTDWPQLHDGSLIASGEFSRELAKLSLYDWKTDSDFAWWSRPLKWGEVGCSVGHWMIWQKAYEMGLPEVYVFEDDALLREGLAQSISSINQEIEALSISPELLYLGRVIEGVDRPVSARLVEPGYSHCTYAYRLSRDGLKSLLATTLWSNIIPVDEFLPAMYMKHPREDIAELFPPRISALAVDPEIVSQRSKSDAGSDTEGSRFVF